MAGDFKWVIGNLATGNITATLDDGVADDSMITRDVFGDDVANVSIAWNSLPSSARENWETYFRAGTRFIALVDDDRAWSHRHAVLFAGIISKVEHPLGGGTFRLQATSLRDYLAARYVLPKDGTVTDPEAKLNLQAGSPKALLSRLINRCFSPSGHSGPLPPDVLGDSPAYDVDDDDFKVSITYADGKTYDEVAQELCDEEWMEMSFQPRYASAAMERILWDLEVIEFPQAGMVTTHWLDNRTKLSAASAALDSTNLFSRIWTFAEDSADDEKIRLAPSVASSGSLPVLYERLEDFGVPMTAGAQQARANRYLTQEGNKNPQEFTATYEETSRASLLDLLGELVRYRGIAGTLSQGIDITTRVLSVEFSPLRRSVTLTVQEPQVRYKRLPRPGRIGDKNDRHKGGVRERRKPDGGGGGITPTPPNPWEPGPRPPESTVIGQWGFGSGPIAEFPLLHKTKVQLNTVRTYSFPWVNALTIQESNLMYAMDTSDSQSTITYSAPLDSLGNELPEFTFSASNAIRIYGSYLTGNGEVMDVNLAYEGTPVDSMFGMAMKNFLDPLILGAPDGYLTYQVRVNIGYTSAVLSGGYIRVPVIVNMIYRQQTNPNASSWTHNSSLSYESKLIFLIGKIDGHTGVSEWKMESNVWTEFPDDFGEVQGQRLGEAQTIWYPSWDAARTLQVRRHQNSAVIIDHRALEEINGPLQQWYIPTLPYDFSAKSQGEVYTLAYGMYESDLGLVNALYVSAQYEVTSTTKKQVVWVMPTYANSLIPNAEDYSWSLVTESSEYSWRGASRDMRSQASRTTTWYGRAVLLITTTAGGPSSRIFSGVSVAGQGFSLGSAVSSSYCAWNNYLFLNNGTVFQVNWAS